MVIETPIYRRKGKHQIERIEKPLRVTAKGLYIEIEKEATKEPYEFYVPKDRVFSPGEKQIRRIENLRAEIEKLTNMLERELSAMPVAVLPDPEPGNEGDESAS